MKSLKEYNQDKYNHWQTNLKESRLARVRQLILAEKPGKILDIGCNNGAFSVQFRQKGWQVFGLDYHIGMISSLTCYLVLVNHSIFSD